MPAKKATTGAKAAKGNDTAKGAAKKANPKAPAKAPAKAAEKAKLSALDAAARVLAEAGGSMSTAALVAAVAERKLWTSPNGQTPAATSTPPSSAISLPRGRQPLPEDRTRPVRCHRPCRPSRLLPGRKATVSATAPGS